MTVLFRQEAEADLRAIVEYYETVAPESLGNILADIRRSIDQVMVDDIVEFGAIAHGYSEDRGERLAARLSSDPHITGFEIRPQQA